MVTRPDLEILSARHRFYLLLLALGTSLWGARSCFPLIAGMTPRSVKYDIDCVWLMTGIEPTPTFAQTLRWWTGPWCCEFVPYYRPTTSLFFWLEYRAFGPNGLPGFTTVHLLSHLVMATLTALFLAELVGWRRAMIVMPFWGLHLTRYLHLGDTSKTFPVWKDSCDLWCCICYILSLWLFLHHIRTGKRSGLILSIFAYLAALTFKEMAYPLPLMIALLLWYEDRWKRHAKALLYYGGIALGGILFRFWALHGPGFRNGTNGAWLPRTIIDLCGVPGKNLVNSNALPVALALLFIAVWFSRRRKRMAFGLATGSLLLWMIAAWQTQISMVDVLFRLLLPDVWLEALASGIGLWLAWRFLRLRRRVQRLGYGWVVIAHIPLMAMPVGEHGFYLVAIGWALWFGEEIEALPQWWRQRQANRRADGQERAPSAV